MANGSRGDCNLVDDAWGIGGPEYRGCPQVEYSFARATHFSSVPQWILISGSSYVLQTLGCYELLEAELRESKVVCSDTTLSGACWINTFLSKSNAGPIRLIS